MNNIIGKYRQRLRVGLNINDNPAQCTLTTFSSNCITLYKVLKSSSYDGGGKTLNARPFPDNRWDILEL